MAGALLARRMKRQLGALLDQRATVYTRAPSGGAYSVVATSGLACLLQPVTALNPPPTGPQRAELADARTLYWDPAYTMPEGAQVEVDAEPGGRWNVVAATIAPDVGPGGVVVMRHCEVRRARSG